MYQTLIRFIEKNMAEDEIEDMKKYIDGLEEDSAFLSCLEGAGVDNWDGYSYAQEMLDNETKD